MLKKIQMTPLFFYRVIGFVFAIAEVSLIIRDGYGSIEAVGLFASVP